MTVNTADKSQRKHWQSKFLRRFKPSDRCYRRIRPYSTPQEAWNKHECLDDLLWVLSQVNETYPLLVRFMLEAFDHYYRVTYGRDHGQYYKELEPYFDVLKRYADGETNYETVMKAYEKFRVLSEQVENSDDSNLHQIRFYDNFSRLFEYLGVGAEPVCFLIMDRNMERDTVKEYERMLKTERQWQLQKLREYFPDITIYVKLK